MSTKIFAMINAFWLVVTKVLLNLVKASVSTNTSSFPSLNGSIFRKLIQRCPGDYWQHVTPAVYVNLCSDPLQHDTNDNWLHTLLCPGTLYSIRISPSQEPMCSQIPDDQSHHVTCKAQLAEVLQGAPTGVTLHH